MCSGGEVGQLVELEEASVLADFDEGCQRLIGFFAVCGGVDSTEKFGLSAFSQIADEGANRDRVLRPRSFHEARTDYLALLPPRLFAEWFLPLRDLHPQS